MSNAPGARLRLPDAELTWRFSRSSGPGGQHVNTSDTRAEVSWDPASTSALTPAQRDRVLVALQSRLESGLLTVGSSRYRSQHRNREDARSRLEALVAAAAAPPAPPRRPTRASRRSRERRRASEQRRAQVKRERRGDWGWG